MADASKFIYSVREVGGLTQANLEEFFSAVMVSVKRNVDYFTDYGDELVVSRATYVDSDLPLSKRVEWPAVVVGRKDRPEFAELVCAVEFADDKASAHFIRLGFGSDIYRKTLESQTMPADEAQYAAVEDEDGYYSLVIRAAELPLGEEDHGHGCGCGHHHHHGHGEGHGCGHHHHDQGEGCGCGGHEHGDESGCDCGDCSDGCEDGCGGGCGGCGGCSGGHCMPEAPFGQRVAAEWAEKVFADEYPDNLLLGRYKVQQIGEDDFNRLQGVLHATIAQVFIMNYEQEDLSKTAIVPLICVLADGQECPTVLTVRDDHDSWADVFVSIRKVEDGAELALGFANEPSEAYQQIIASDESDVDAHTELGEECAFYGTAIAAIHSVFGIE